MCVNFLLLQGWNFKSLNKLLRSFEIQAMTRCVGNGRRRNVRSDA